ncbi:four helix bundle protein [Candidatus Shapirobacteria bacterium CG08_land_8_20_14_0_20_39_18]|uniref:Four helix bundle protein n=1 Tax=Candidatus Shapirobacteria bacterium CG08_land_8_20_14_0_20_39_18 TaxID=1974883 RepID=A0A2M6XCV3_9BACT|nr:MAG: four helix bundle protein [Candidatus Shapirobacteria bacterium CG08_land_8_20_14_0_20_39_18]PIY65108.1 MAG: four helix bundle protein [Candidatus Shapirobacteria bacterium CG_4_10_14_0_8_um_filter_39_15]
MDSNIVHSTKCIERMENPPSSHKNLIVYQKAKTLTIDVINYFANAKLDRVSEILIKQLIRAVSSIGANIAEGYGRHYSKSYHQFLGIARGSSFEADYWLEIILETNKFDEQIIKKFKDTNEELIKILTTLMKNTS